MSKLYLDTSVIIALANTQDQFHDTSQRFVKEMTKHSSIVVGPALFLEIGKAVEQKGTEAGRILIETVEKLGIVQANVEPERMFEIADFYALNGVISKRFTFDLLHYAGATLLGCSHLASWDKTHFNARIAERINKLNLSRGLTTLIVGDPLTILRDMRIG